MMTIVFSLFLLSMLVIVAVAVLRTDNLFTAVMLSGIFSLIMAANFFVLDAADVALTEAVIGAGISTVLFLGALALTSEQDRSPPVGSWVPLLSASALGGVIIYAVLQAPRLGDPEAVVHGHVAPWYLEKTPELIDVPNVVTAVLASFRGYDTLGEVFVVFTACIGVMSLLGRVRPLRETISEEEFRAQSRNLRHHLIPRVVGKILIPFIVLFGLYVQFHGDFGPGGGFQAGALVAAGIILYALLEGDHRARELLPEWFSSLLVALGALTYTSVGVACMVLGGRFLDYSVLDPHNAVHGQHLGILLVEAGVGMTVAGVMITIFHAFARRGIR
jgi:multicomponent Na+:H+ antiporter subunit B